MSSVRLLFHLSLQLLPLLSSPASIAIFGQDRWGCLLLHSMSLWSSSSVHLCLCSFGLDIMDFPAKMEEINPISFPSNILLLKNQRSPIVSDHRFQSDLFFHSFASVCILHPTHPFVSDIRLMNTSPLITTWTKGLRVCCQTKLFY